jgi:hypothetical protein
VQTEWQIDESGFPRTGTLAQRIRFALRYAILAPSSHNTQPWRFNLDGDTVTLVADRTRSLPVVDPYDRELIASLGAALFNLRAALAHFGMSYAIDIFPVKADADLVARIKVADAQAPDANADVARLAAAIPFRATNRHAFSPIGVPGKVQDFLLEAARAEGVSIRAIDDLNERKRLAALVARADQAQFGDARFRRELASWVHPSRDRDGMPAYAFGIPQMLDFEAGITSMVLRTFDLGDGVAANDAGLVAGSPLLLCFSTMQDDAPAWLFAGQALQRVLLTAKLEGYDASFLNQPIEVPALRTELRNLLGTAPNPQLLIRVGRGEVAQHTPRRPLAEVAP